MKKACVLILIIMLIPLSILSENIGVFDLPPDELLILWNKIGEKLRDEGYYPYLELRIGDMGDDVLKLQERLLDLGYFSKVVTGK